MKLQSHFHIAIFGLCTFKRSSWSLFCLYFQKAPTTSGKSQVLEQVFLAAHDIQVDVGANKTLKPLDLRALL